MTTAEAKKLKIGDCVCWNGDPNDRGEVVEVGYLGVKIRWEKIPPDEQYGDLMANEQFTICYFDDKGSDIMPMVGLLG
jgi:hypothetical protein